MQIRVPALAQVFPIAVHPLDQPDLLFPSPALDLLFARNRLVNVVEALVIHQSAHVEMAGESVNGVRLVLPYTPDKIIGYAGVQNAGSIRDDVNVVAVVPDSLGALSLDSR